MGLGGTASAMWFIEEYRSGAIMTPFTVSWTACMPVFPRSYCRTAPGAVGGWTWESCSASTTPSFQTGCASLVRQPSLTGLTMALPPEIACAPLAPKSANTPSMPIWMPNCAMPASACRSFAAIAPSLAELNPFLKARIGPPSRALQTLPAPADGGLPASIITRRGCRFRLPSPGCVLECAAPDASRAARDPLPAPERRQRARPRTAAPALRAGRGPPASAIASSTFMTIRGQTARAISGWQLTHEGTGYHLVPNEFSSEMLLLEAVI